MNNSKASRRALKTLVTASSLTLTTALAAPLAAQTLGTEDGPSVTFSGFVDTSVVIPIVAPDDADEVSFGLDQVELDIEATPVAGSGLTIRADLEVFPQSASFVPDDLFEQGYIDWEHENGFFLRAGKANVPWGAEGVDPVDLYQYSFGQIPTATNLTGLFTGYRSDTISAQVWVTNGWDTPGMPRSASMGARLEYAFAPGYVALTADSGPLPGGNPHTIFDIDTGLTFGDLTFLGEVNLGMHEDFMSIGALTTFSYAISDATSATVRFDYLTSTETVAGVDLTTSNASITGAGLFTLAENFGLVAEVRADVPNEGDVGVTSALELLAWW